jgi:hypothetical protein
MRQRSLSPLGADEERATLCGAKCGASTKMSDPGNESVRTVTRFRGVTSWRSRMLDILRDAGSVADPLPFEPASARRMRLDDTDALASDWEAVGRDMARAFQMTLPVPGQNRTRASPDARTAGKPRERRHPTDTF